jgi:DNA polymerase III delta prime subunit
LLFYGPPGSGKTTALFALATELFGEYRNHMILELNGSDERGIMVIRDKIKQFASTRNLLRPTYPKLIILDEADNMTYDAQFALRRIIELYTNNVRFCFLCNWENKVIDAIKSRCLVYRFNRLGNDTISRQIAHVIEQEQMYRNLSPEERNEIAQCIGETSEGDMRKAYNLLEYIRYKTCTVSSTIDSVYQSVYGTTLTAMTRLHRDIAVEDATSNRTWECINKLMEENNIGLSTMIRILTFVAKTNRRWSFLNHLALINYRFNVVSCSNTESFVRLLCATIDSEYREYRENRVEA